MATQNRFSLAASFFSCTALVLTVLGGCSDNPDALNCAPDDLTCEQPTLGKNDGPVSQQQPDAAAASNTNNNTNTNTNNTNSNTNSADGGVKDGGGDGGGGGKGDGGGAKADGGPAASGAVGSSCTSNAGCSSDLCLDLGKGKHCTKLCKDDADCPAPSTGCGIIKLCKAAP